MFRLCAAVAGMLVAAGAVSAAEGLRTDTGDNRLVGESPADSGPWRGRGISVEIWHPDPQAPSFGTIVLSNARAGDWDSDVGRFHTPNEDWGAHFTRRAAGRDRPGASPGTSVGGIVGTGIGDGWDLQVGMRRTPYGLGSTELRLVRAERTLGDHRLAYTRYASPSPAGGSVPSHRVQWSYLVGARASVGLALATGREFDRDASSTLAVTGVRDTMIFGRYWFRSDWAVSAEGISHEQGELARRYGLRLGLQHRF